ASEDARFSLPCQLNLWRNQFNWIGFGTHHREWKDQPRALLRDLTDADADATPIELQNRLPVLSFDNFIKCRFIHSSRNEVPSITPGFRECSTPWIDCFGNHRCRKCVFDEEHTGSPACHEQVQPSLTL